MFISKLFLESFGKFNQNEIELSEGINCVYGKNEDGKSTVKSFIAYILSSLHHSYSTSKISDQYKKYAPFNSEEFKGGLLCNQLCDKEDQVLISKNFDDDNKPAVTNMEGSPVDLENRVIDVIGFKELQGEQSKDLLIDVLNRIEDMKNSNIEGVHASDLFSRIENKAIRYKKEHNIMAVKDELKEIEDYLKDYAAHYKGYKNLCEDIFRIKKEMKNAEHMIASGQADVDQASLVDLMLLQQNIESVSEQIEAYESKLEALDEFSDIDMNQAEESLTANKAAESLKIQIDDKKELLYELENKIRINGMGKEFSKIAKLTYDEDVRNLRSAVRNLIDQTNKIQSIRQSITDYVELKDSAKRSAKANTANKFDIARIAQDYYKYVNISEWVESIKKEIEVLEAGKPDEDLDLILEAQMKKNRLFGFFGVAGVLVGSGLFLVSMLFVILIIAGFGIAGWFFYQYIVVKDALEHHKAKEKTYDLEYKKYNQMIIDNETKMNEILKRHQCEDTEAFYALYLGTKDVHANFTELDNKIEDLDEELKKQEVAMKMAISDLKEAETVYGIELKEYFLEPHVLEEKVESYILEAKEHIRVYNVTQDMKDEIRLLEEQLKMEPQTLQTSAKDVEEKSIAYQLTKHELERLYQQKESYLNEMDEVQLADRLKSMEHVNTDKVSTLNGNTKELSQNLRDQKAVLIELTDQLTELKQEAERQENYLNKASELRRKKKQLQYIVEAVNNMTHISDTTVNIMRKSSMSITGHMTERVEEKISEIVYSITGRYDKIRFNEDLSIEFYHKSSGTWKNVRTLSAGTIDQVYIALRLAIVELTEGKNDFPLVFDDSFVQYDKKRLRKILSYLATLDRQVIVLTCHRREQDLMKEMAINHHYVQLS